MYSKTYYTNREMYQLSDTETHLSTNELIELLNDIPKEVTELSLESIELGNRSQEELIAIFTAIPRWITDLSLANNSLEQKQDYELVSAFALLPQELTYLALTDNYIARPSFDLGLAFDALPKYLKALALETTSLDRIETSELVKALKKLPPKLQELDLGFHDFRKKQDKEITQIIESIPATVRKLDMRNCCLGNKGISLIKALSPQVTELSMSGNYLKSIVTAFFQAIPPTLKSLDISNNQIADAPNITNALAAIPSNITTLNCGDNLFYRLSVSQFIAFFEALPEGIKELTLNNADIGQFPEGDLKKFGKALKYVVTIHLSGTPYLDADPQFHPIEIIRSHIGSWVVKAHPEVNGAMIQHNNSKASEELALTVMSYFATEETNIATFIKNNPEQKEANPVLLQNQPEQPVIESPQASPSRSQFFKGAALVALGAAALTSCYMLGN